MLVTSLTYTRLHNLGDYEHEKIELVIELAEGDTPSAALNRARKFIDAKLLLNATEVPCEADYDTPAEECERKAAEAKTSAEKAYYQKQAQTQRECAEWQKKRVEAHKERMAKIEGDVAF